MFQQARPSSGQIHTHTASNIWFRYITFLWVLLLPVNGSPANGLDPIGVCAVEWPPYTSKQMPNAGIASELITKVLNDMGYSPQFVFMSTLACENLVADNDTNEGIQGALGYLWTKKRENKGLAFSDPLFDIEEVIFLNRIRIGHSSKIQNIRSLSNFKAAFVEGYAHTPAIESVHLKIKDDVTKLEYVENDIAAFKKLVDGDVDWVPADFTAGTYILKKEFPYRRNTIGVLREFNDNKSPVYFMVSDRNPDNKEFKDRLKESLERIKKTSNFRHRIRRIQGNKPQIVRLEDASGLLVPGMIQHKNDQNNEIDARAYLLPRGTLAEVIEWPDSIRHDHRWPLDATILMNHYATVRILNGPHSGRVLRIQMQYIVLDKQ